MSTALLTEILHWKEEGCEEVDIVERLRRRTVPEGYEYHTWQPGNFDYIGFTFVCMNKIPYKYFNLGKTETVTEKFRAILAQLEYSFTVNEWQNQGVPFKNNYVPEVHPATGFPFHEREDEAHVFKVHCINICLLECFIFHLLQTS